MRSRHRKGPLIAALVLALGGCVSQTDSRPVEPGPSVSGAGSTATVVQPEAAALVENLDAPWSVTFHEGAALVSERDTAQIVEVVGDDVRVVGVISDVTPQGEGGLLGIAAREGDLYVYLTASGENRIDRYELTGQPGSLGLGPSDTILDGIPAAGYHDGGRIAFGPDGLLYATTGDAGHPSSAQDLDVLSGKILRLTPDGAVPADNPFAGSYVYSYGHRNPQGIAWDAAGTLYASEFGQNTWDELNVIEAGGNYGWPDVEGVSDEEGFIDPVQQWPPSQASPSGIAVWQGSIFIANLRGRVLRAVPLDDLGGAIEHLTGEYGRLRDAVVAPDGSLWVVTNNTDGRGDPAAGDDRILRLVQP